MKNQAQGVSTALENSDPPRRNVTNGAHSSSAFFRLAPEIRVQIYQLLFHEATVFFERDWRVTRFATENYFPEITRVNRQLRSETLPLLYHSLVLQVGGSRAKTRKRLSVVSLPEELTRHVERIQIWENHLLPKNLSSLTNLKVLIYERYPHDVCENCKDRKEEIWFDSQDEDAYKILGRDASKQLSALFKISYRDGYAPHERTSSISQLRRLQKKFKSLKIVMSLSGLFPDSVYRDVRHPSERVVFNILSRRIELIDVHSLRAVDIGYNREDDVFWGYIQALPRSGCSCRVRRLKRDDRSLFKRFEQAFLWEPWRCQHFYLASVIYFILFLMVAAFEYHRDQFGL